MSDLHDIQFPNESADYRRQRMKLLEEEIDLRKKLEDVAALRRQLPPGGELKKDYVFDELDSSGNSVSTRFSSLFEKEKSSLLVYSFMYAPGDENACPACTSMLDGLNGSAAHIRDKVNFVVVGKAPLDKLNAWASKRNWNGLRLLSSFKNSYNHDYFGESADGKQQMPVMNVFTKNDAGIMHSYSTELLFTAPGEEQHPRHADLFWPICALFDLTPEGRGGGWFQNSITVKPRITRPGQTQVWIIPTQKIPEHINTTREHPLKEFLLLSSGILGAIILVILLLSLVAEILAPHVPFSMEEEIAGRFIDSPDTDSETYHYLQNLVDGLTPHLQLDPGVKVTLHYVDDEVQNAFATLGGHIFIHRGLLEMLPQENALCMVIAHEIAHVKFRHPLIATGRGLTVLMLLAAVTGFGGDRIAGNIIGNVGALTVLSFSRKQESQADRAALAALQGYYGHVSGADELFRILRDKRDDAHSAEMEFFSTHPLSSERIEAMSDYARENNWSKEGATTPLKHDGS